MRRLKLSQAELHKLEMKRLKLEIRWRYWHYKNIALLLLSLGVFIYLLGLPAIDDLIKSVGGLGYLGALIAGLLFVSTFTVAPAGVILYHLAEVLNPYEIAVLAGAGAVLGDYIVFRYLKDRVFEELRPLGQKLASWRKFNIFRTPYFAWLTPVIGALVIASPFPDELGITLMGISKIKTWQFLALAFLLNAFGILVVILLART